MPIFPAFLDSSAYVGLLQYHVRHSWRHRDSWKCKEWSLATGVHGPVSWFHPLRLEQWCQVAPWTQLSPWSKASCTKEAQATTAFVKKGSCILDMSVEIRWNHLSWSGRPIRLWLDWLETHGRTLQWFVPCSFNTRYPAAFALSSPISLWSTSLQKVSSEQETLQPLPHTNVASHRTKKRSWVFLITRRRKKKTKETHRPFSEI